MLSSDSKNSLVQPRHTEPEETQVKLWEERCPAPAASNSDISHCLSKKPHIRGLLIPSAPYAAIDPCVGDVAALIEITKDSGAYLAGIEFDADRAAAAGAQGVATVHGSA